MSHTICPHCKTEECDYDENDNFCYVFTKLQDLVMSEQASTEQKNQYIAISLRMAGDE